MPSRASTLTAAANPTATEAPGRQPRRVELLLRRTDRILITHDDTALNLHTRTPQPSCNDSTYDHQGNAQIYECTDQLNVLPAPTVRGLGATWLDRGRPYRIRRVARSAGALILFVLSTLVTFGFATAIVSYLPSLLAAVAIGIVVISVGHSGRRFWSVLVVEPRERVRATQTLMPKTGSAKANPRRKSSTSIACTNIYRKLTPVWHALSAVFLGFSVPFCAGWGAAWFLASLRHDYPGELEARVQYQSSLKSKSLKDKSLKDKSLKDKSSR